MLAIGLMALWLSASPLSTQDTCILRWAANQMVSPSILVPLSPQEQEMFWRELILTLTPTLRAHRHRYAATLRRGEFPVCGALE